MLFFEWMINEEQRSAARCINVVCKKPHSTDNKQHEDHLKVRTRILELEKTSCSINLHLPFLSVSDKILRTLLKTKLVLWQLVVECSFIFFWRKDSPTWIFVFVFVFVFGFRILDKFLKNDWEQTFPPAVLLLGVFIDSPGSLYRKVMRAVLLGGRAGIEEAVSWKMEKMIYSGVHNDE